MNPPANPSYAQWILTGGGTCGTAIFVVGGLVTVWGLVNLAGTRNRTIVLAQLAASLVPVLIVFLAARPILGALGVVTKATAFVPPPGFMEDMAGLALRSISGPLATVIPAILGLIQLARLQAKEGSGEG